MASSASGTCRQCGWPHRTRADLLACDAIHGKLRGWPAVADPRCVCALCGLDDYISELLYHFKYAHGREPIRTGELVRDYVETRDVSAYEGP